MAVSNIQHRDGLFKTGLCLQFTVSLAGTSNNEIQEKPKQFRMCAENALS